MNQQKSLLRIAELLSRFKLEAIILNANAQLDINILAEDILIPILDIAYGCKLENAKYSENDNRFPALDLLDKSNRIAFQITSTSNIKKARETLEKIVLNNFYNQFDTFYIYIITQKKDFYEKKVLEKATQNHFSFSEKNILDETDLYKKIASLPYNCIEKIESLLENQFVDKIKHESEIQNTIYEIIQSVKEKFNEQFLVSELEGAYKVRQSWVDKKIFFEGKQASLSDINQQFSFTINLEEINRNIENCNGVIFKLFNKIPE